MLRPCVTIRLAAVTSSPTMGVERYSGNNITRDEPLSVAVELRGYTIGSAPHYTIGSAPHYTIGSAPHYTIGSAPHYTIGSAPQ